MYQTDEVVVYRRDVCTVKGTQKNTFTGEMCYVLEPYNGQEGSVIMQVPVSNKGGHLRTLISKEGIEQLCKKVSEIHMLESKPANMKSKYLSLLQSDSIEDLISIIKTATARNQLRIENRRKQASVDVEFLSRAEKYLFNELSIALGVDYDEAKAYFMKQVARYKK